MHNNNLNRICKLYQIKYPIIQGGMVWCSGWKLASAVSNNGGLGLLGAGSMHPETLQEHIRKTKIATNKPFGVNVPMLYPQISEIMEIIANENVPIVFTSAGSPKLWTEWLHKKGIIVTHVVSSSLFAKKCQDANVDAVVAEGFEAGGHNGREETTTMALIPSVRKLISLPLIAAGGIGNGQSMLASMALGAEAVQIGSLFAIARESSAHDNFKNLIINLKEGDTKLTLKQLNPVRLIKNDFFNKVNEAELRGASIDELINILGKYRSKMGMFEGNLIEGKLEIGQNSAYFNKILSVDEIFKQLLFEFEITKQQLSNFSF